MCVYERMPSLNLRLMAVQHMVTVFPQSWPRVMSALGSGSQNVSEPAGTFFFFFFTGVPASQIKSHFSPGVYFDCQWGASSGECCQWNWKWNSKTRSKWDLAKQVVLQTATVTGDLWTVWGSTLPLHFISSEWPILIPFGHCLVT